MSLRDIGTVLLWLATIPAVGFVVFYAVASRWWGSPIGRQQMALRFALALALLLILTARVFGNYPGRAVVSIVVFALLVFVLWWGLALLVSVQRHELRDRRDGRRRQSPGDRADARPDRTGPDQPD